MSLYRENPKSIHMRSRSVPQESKIAQSKIVTVFESEVRQLTEP
jgi:hypothetical protein